jgi:hypothetical protein
VNFKQLIQDLKFKTQSKSTGLFTVIVQQQGSRKIVGTITDDPPLSSVIKVQCGGNVVTLYTYDSEFLAGGGTQALIKQQYWIKVYGPNGAKATYGPLFCIDRQKVAIKTYRARLRRGTSSMGSDANTMPVALVFTKMTDRNGYSEGFKELRKRFPNL